jgi:hypothetical protein
MALRARLGALAVRGRRASRDQPARPGRPVKASTSKARYLITVHFPQPAISQATSGLRLIPDTAGAGTERLGSTSALSRGHRGPLVLKVQLELPARMVLQALPARREARVLPPRSQRAPPPRAHQVRLRTSPTSAPAVRRYSTLRFLVATSERPAARDRPAVRGQPERKVRLELPEQPDRLVLLEQLDQREFQLTRFPRPVSRFQL